MPDENVVNSQSTETETAEVTKVTEPTVISVPNPSDEDMAGILAAVKAGYDYDVDVKSVEFKFKKSTDKETGIITDRKPVILPVPYPSIPGIVAILEAGGKQLELLQEAVEQVVNASVREMLGESNEISAENFDVTKVSWEAIANQPKAQRRGGGIPKEVWEGFITDYCSVMPDAAGKTIDQVTKMAGILKNKLSAVRDRKPILEVVIAQLAIYAGHSESAGEYTECVEFLLTKADGYMNVTPEELLAAL